jgi:hypothetical protein
MIDEILDIMQIAANRAEYMAIWFYLNDFVGYPVGAD